MAGSRGCCLNMRAFRPSLADIKAFRKLPVQGYFSAGVYPSVSESNQRVLLLVVEIQVSDLVHF
jgi:hypothetical protein